MRSTDAYVIAGSENTNSRELWSLYRSGCKRIKERIAENPLCPADLIDVLSNDIDADVKAALARNKSVGLSTLESLCDDDDINVRLSLAHEPSLPQFLLEKLSRDSNPYVCDSAERTLEILLLEQSLKASGFVHESGKVGKLGELIWMSGIAKKDAVIRCLEISLNQNMHLGQVLIQELSIDRYLIVQALQLQSLIRKGKITLKQAVINLSQELKKEPRKVS